MPVGLVLGVGAEEQRLKAILTLGYIVSMRQRQKKKKEKICQDGSASASKNTGCNSLMARVRSPDST